MTNKNNNEGKNELLSLEAIEWLTTIGYDKKTHEERMILIEAARIAYPDKVW